MNTFEQILKFGYFSHVGALIVGLQHHAFMPLTVTNTNKENLVKCSWTLFVHKVSLTSRTNVLLDQV